jgi:hypothetical protein
VSRRLATNSERTDSEGLARPVGLGARSSATAEFSIDDGTRVCRYHDDLRDLSHRNVYTEYFDGRRMTRRLFGAGDAGLREMPPGMTPCGYGPSDPHAGLRTTGRGWLP